ncbi:hypothetical protein M0C34_07910 [Agarivorans sp. TSD2052]|uniref:hypothetical protein n=1 Tax=Agarivorans sp. TSD2052 TaxID=2937286 RepID=UPI00200D6E32|nr:hypothetical protein [Agarivorans sp. TSD2052]UPW20176.1 hypothetical protein M0C34_07910 [Agarivorans sp. TSD2052]
MKFIILGTGSFAQKLYATFTDYSLNVTAFIDEFAVGELQGLPIYKASEIPPAFHQQEHFFFIAISHPEYAKAAKQRLLKQGLTGECIYQIDDDSSNILISSLLEQSTNKFCSSLKQAKGDFVQVENMFSQSAIPTDEISFRLFNRATGFLKHLGHLPASLAQKHNSHLLCDENIAGYEVRLCSQQRAMQTPAKLVVTSQLLPCSPKETPKLTMVHAIYDSAMYRDSLISNLKQAEQHFIAVASKASMKQFKSIVEEHQLNNVTLLAAGYPKLDLAIDNYQEKSNSERITLLYAPTQSYTQSEECKHLYSINFAQHIMNELLALGEQYQVVFRPHPEDLSLANANAPGQACEIFQWLLALENSEPRFQIDRGNQNESFANANIMLSDSSSSAYSFAFTSLKPVLFLSFNEHELSNSALKNDYFNDRQKIGFINQKIENLALDVHRLLEQKDAFKSRIQQLRHSQIFNLGHSQEYLRSQVTSILNTKTIQKETL